MKLMKNSIIPLLLLIFITWIGKNIFIVDGQIDWFRAMLVYGIPFGIPYMVFIIPMRGDVSQSLGGLTASVMIGAFFGIFIAAGAFIKAVCYLIYAMGSKLYRCIK